MTSSMRFGVSLFPYDRFSSAAEIINVARRAEELGYYAVTLPEHKLAPAETGDLLVNRTWYDIPTLGSLLAGRTSTIRIFSYVLVLPYHEPIGLARALATLDVLSDGRLLCGVGAGWFEAEFRALGIPFAERAAITDEYVRLLRALWAEGSCAFSGRYCSLPEVTLTPKPVQQPRLPLLMGGTGPRPLRRVVQYGDGWIPMRATFDELQRGIAWIRAEKERAGEAVEDLLFGGGSLVMSADPDLQRLRGHAGADLRRDHTRTAAQAIEEIQQHREVGVNYLSVGFAWQSADQYVAQLERFAHEVMPVFAGS